MKSALLFIATLSLSLNLWAAPTDGMPDAVCDNGEVTGNTHCVTRAAATISSIPMPSLATSPLGIALVVVAGVVLWRIKK